MTRRLYVLLEPELKEAGLDILYHEIEIPLANVLANMEQAGIRLDAERLAKIEKVFVGEIETLEKKAWTIAGEEFNLASPKQVGKILFEKLELPVIRKTKSGPLRTQKSFRLCPFNMNCLTSFSNIGRCPSSRDLRNSVTATNSRRHGSYPHAVQSNGNGNGTFIFFQPEPAKYTE